MIKKYSLLAVMVLSFIACKSKTGTASEETTAASSETTAAAAPVTATATVSAASVKDPVCGMEEGDEKWTESVVNGTDTTWFCSPHCKDQYVKNPDKYKKATAPKG